jgi:Ni,Fe-hydrogenase III small subunit
MFAVLKQLLKHGNTTIPKSELLRGPSIAIKTKKQQNSSSMTETETRLANQIKKVFGRSLHIRHVDTGSCNACEWEIIALMNPVYDIKRFGIDFVASPRHADMLLVTGGVTRNLEHVVRKVYDATPDPKMVVAVGDCACGSDGIGRTYANLGGLAEIVPVTAYVPGCPPHPQAILQGILKAIERL